MNHRRVNLTAISAIGATHFIVGLGWWMFLFVRVIPPFHVWLLPKRAMFELIIIPLGNCVVLLSAFLFAVRLSLRESRHAELAIWLTTLVTAIVFLVDTELSFAQIHVFGTTRWSNHFFMTWWLYSQMPYLTFTVRLVVASLCLTGMSFLLWRIHVISLRAR